MKILVACEYSGIVRDAFASRGHDAWSCDILDTESLQRVQSAAPLGYGPSARDVAESVAFLAKSPAITGQTIFVDSGERFRQMKKDPALDKGE